MNCENCGSGISINEPHVIVSSDYWYHTECYEPDPSDNDVEFCE